MRVVSLAVCVVLVGHAAANIISKRFQPQMELMMQPSDYVDQYQTKFQMPEQYQPQYPAQGQQPSQYQIQNEQKYQMMNDKYQPQYQVPNETYEPQYQIQNEKYQPKYQMQSEKQQKYQMKKEKYQPQYMVQNEKYQPQYPIQNEKYQPQYQFPIENYQPQYEMQGEKKSQMTKFQKQQQKAIRSKKARKPVDSEETMADDTRSWMSAPVIPRAQQWDQTEPAVIPHTQQWDQSEPAFIPRTQKWDEPMFAAVPHINEVAPAFGDVITWRDIQIAAGPASPVTDKKEIERIFEDAYQSMAHVKAEDKHAIHTAFEAAAHDHSTYLQAQMNATELVRASGYSASEHLVRTRDGYELTVLRIAAAGAADAASPRRVVLMLPGLLGAAEDWLLMGPQHSLAYRLADAGHDVWIGAFRGGRYGRKHASLSPAQDEFWHFSIDELALQDVPAIIDHVLAESGQAALHIVAHSLGVTAALELLATQPAYNDKVAGVYALAPLAHTAGARSPLLRMLAPSSSFSAMLAAQLGDAAFRPPRALLLAAGGALLQAELGCANVSGDARLVLSGARMDGVEAAPALARAVRSTDATSVRVVRQLAAAAAARHLARYDHGARVNMELYGAATAPAVDLTKVSAPVQLLPAAADWLAAPADVARLAAELPRATSWATASPQETATDLLFSAPAADRVNDIVLRTIAATPDAPAAQA